jgi:hypothetical protein
MIMIRPSRFIDVLVTKLIPTLPKLGGKREALPLKLQDLLPALAAVDGVSVPYGNR